MLNHLYILFLKAGSPLMNQFWSLPRTNERYDTLFLRNKTPLHISGHTFLSSSSSSFTSSQKTSIFLLSSLRWDWKIINDGYHKTGYCVFVVLLVGHLSNFFWFSSIILSRKKEGGERERVGEKRESENNNNKKLVRSPWGWEENCRGAKIRRRSPREKEGNKEGPRASSFGRKAFEKPPNRQQQQDMYHQDSSVPRLLVGFVKLGRLVWALAGWKKLPTDHKKDERLAAVGFVLDFFFVFFVRAFGFHCLSLSLCPSILSVYSRFGLSLTPCCCCCSCCCFEWLLWAAAQDAVGRGGPLVSDFCFLNKSDVKKFGPFLPQLFLFNLARTGRAIFFSVKRSDSTGKENTGLSFIFNWSKRKAV